MIITFLAPRRYSPNAWDVYRGLTGDIRDVPDNAAFSLIREGAALAGEHEIAANPADHYY